MKKKTQFSLLLISISFFSCNSAVKNAVPPLSNIDADFTVIEKLELNPFKEYDNLKFGTCIIDDHIWWNFREGSRDFGSCYDLNTGKKLSVIATRGDAPHELTGLEGARVTDDFVLLSPNKRVIKAVAKKDIINNIPPENRTFSVTTIPNDILVSQMTKLPNGSILATIHPARFESEKGKRQEINKNSVIIFDNNKIKSYETITYDSFEIEKAKETEIAANDLIKWAYAQGDVKTRGNDMAVFSVRDQFILYTLDLNNGNVVNEKRYTKILREKEGGLEISFSTTNDNLLEIKHMEANDKYIFCYITGYSSEKDKQSGLRKQFVFVFDWNLKPVKKFELPYLNKEKDGAYIISKDCRSVYFCEINKEGRTLYKAELKM